MSGPRGNIHFTTWRIPGFPRVIELPQPVANEILGRVVVGFWKASRGGIEVGGVLFGEVTDRTVRILATRPIECEHALGPTFTLSDTDNEKLATLLRLYPNDPGLRQLAPIGWYHSHTRATLALHPTDRELHESHFPEPWQFALVLQPREGKPTCAAVFLPGPDGRLPEEPSRRLEELSAGDSLAPPREEAPAAPPETPSAPTSSTQPVPARLPDPLSKPAAGERPAAFADAVLPFRHYLEEDAQRRGRTIWKWFGVGLLVAAGLVAALLGIRRLDRPEYREKLQAFSENASQYRRQVVSYWSGSWDQALPRAASLEVLRLEGITQMRWTAAAAAGEGGPEAVTAVNALQVRWSLDERLAASAAGATLEIIDGTDRRSSSLPKEDLRAGARIHFARGADVQARLVVARDTGPPVVATARYVGPQKTEAESEAATLREEVDRLGFAVQLKRAESAALINTLASIRQYARQLAAAAAPPPTLVEKRPAGAPVAPALEERRPGAPPIAGVPAYAGPPSGRIIWTGSLDQNQVLTLDAGRPSAGRVSGTLPGVPVRVIVYPAEFTADGLTVFSRDAAHSGGRAEAPAPVNQFTRTTFVFDPARAQAVDLVEAPALRNGWSRLSIRANSSAVSVIFIEWTR